VLFLALLALGLAASASAQQWCKSCDDSCAGNTVTVIGAGEHAGGLAKAACFNFETEGASDSGALQVRADSVLFCLNPADDSDGADTAQVWIRKCLGPNVSATDNNCPRILDSALTGAAGAPETQNACVRSGPGLFYVEVTAAGNADENPYVSAEAEE
jgi:hypothetical protein